MGFFICRTHVNIATTTQEVSAQSESIQHLSDTIQDIVQEI